MSSDTLNEVVLPDGTVRRLGNNSVGVRMFASARTYGDAADEPILTDAQIEEAVQKYDSSPDHPNRPPTHDQDGVGQCNCDAATGCVETQRNIQGLPYLQLSAADLYDRINGGHDNGSMLEDGLEELRTNGVGLASSAGTIWHRGMKDAPAPERKRFMVLEWCVCPTFRHVISAAIKGRAGVSGIMWYDGFDPDADGWLPTVGRGRAGGHAVLWFPKPAFHRAPSNHRAGTVLHLGVWHQNSWGKWGLDGKGACVFPQELYEGDIGGWWTCREVTDEGGTVPAES